tara:strand:+ start:6421 stop:6642 length:222 start_codon:yes stop_codon:yes gene_type:complete
MRFTTSNNLREIQKFYSKRVKKISFLSSKSIENELKEWIDDSFRGKEEVWFLPDLTREERRENFCRSIKKIIY